MTAKDPIAIHRDLALDAGEIGTWEWDTTSGAMSCDTRMRSLLGLSAEVATFEAFIDSIHEQDRTHVRETLSAALQDDRRHQCECRSVSSALRPEHWLVIDGRAYSTADPARHVIGIARDVSARRELELGRELLASDLVHRLANVFSVVTAIVSLSKRTASTPEDAIAHVQARLSALARAHELLPGGSTDATVQLQKIIETQLAPFADSSRTTIGGPSIELRRSQAVALSIIIHELTTNAVKHGALAAEGGHIHIEWRMQPLTAHGYLQLRWKEVCASDIGTPTHAGLGSTLLGTCARQSLGGDFTMDYQRNGLVATLSIPAARFMTSSPN